MNLFNSINTLTENLLPMDGEVYYYNQILSAKNMENYFEALMNTIEWKNDEAFMFGKHIITKRKVAWYADIDFSYSYSNVTRTALSWTRELLELKHISEEKTGETYNSCLLNLYHEGNEGMTWHSDDENSLLKNSAIASLSLGAERRFSFKHKQSKETITLNLQSGSLLLMKGTTQTNWLHSLPKTKMIIGPRINLTFRTML